MKSLKNIRRNLVGIGVFFAVGGCLAFFTTDLMEMLSDTKKETVYVSQPSPVASVPMLPMHSVVSHRTFCTDVSATSGLAVSNTNGMTLSLLSSAQVHAVGGGSIVYSTTEASRNAQKGNGGGGMAMPVSTFYARASSREVASPGAACAPDVSGVTAPPRRGLGGPPPNIGDDDDPENPDLPQPPVPMGDAVGLLAVLAAAYAVKRKNMS